MICWTIWYYPENIAHKKPPPTESRSGERGVFAYESNEASVHVFLDHDGLYIIGVPHFSCRRQYMESTRLLLGDLRINIQLSSYYTSVGRKGGSQSISPTSLWLSVMNCWSPPQAQSLLPGKLLSL